MLRAVSHGRAGVLLNRANELFFAGAEAGVAEIDGDFARSHFNGQGYNVAANGDGPDGYGDDDSDDDDYYNAALA